MSLEQCIPLNLLVPSKANVRRTGRAEGISELAASIAAHGLRQNLNVRQSPEGERFEVVAGGRRLRALKLLAKQGTITGDAPVRCLLIEEGESSEEISLAENTMRTAMHPDDQYEAFRVLIEDKSLPVEEVAARFGVTPAVVKQRLKLAAVSPKLRALFRKGGMSLDHVMAFTISDDHAAQEAAWDSLPEWNRDPSGIKAALTADSVALTDRLAVFIGVEAYELAGGTILRDLFDSEGNGYLADRALVMQLVTAKLELEAEAVRAEGWKWVKPEITRDYGIAYDRLPSGRASAKNKARAGAILRIGHDGALQIERGLIDPKDAKAEAKQAQAETGEPAKGNGYAAGLIEDLTVHRSAALRVELSRNPGVALATLTATLAAQLFHSPVESCLDLQAYSKPLEHHARVAEDSPAHQAMATAFQSWEARLPTAGTEFLPWCLNQPQEVLIELLAFLTALTIDGVSYRQSGGRRHPHADSVAQAVKLDMTAWWTPSVEGFYDRLPKAQLIAAMAEAKVTASAPFDGVKKAEAAKMAAKALHGTGWLPQAMRVA